MLKYRREELERKRKGLLDLTTAHDPELAPRLGETFAVDLSQSFEDMGLKRMTAVGTRQTKQTLTQAQNQKCARVVTLLSGLRDSIKAHHSEDPVILERFGVTTTFEAKSVGPVFEAANKFLEGAKEDPDSVRTAGILTADLTELAALSAELKGTDQTQEGKKTSSKQATADRDAAQERVEQALEKLRAAVKLTFRNDPETIAAFDRAMPVSRNAGKKRAKPGEPKAPGTETE